MIGRKHLLLAGNIINCWELLGALGKETYWVGMCQLNSANLIPHDLLIVKICDENDLSAIELPATPWLAWCASDSHLLMTKAYHMGAVAAFSEETPIPTILQIIANTFALGSNQNGIDREAIIQRRYQRGDIILLEDETILEIQRGIVAQTMIHLDGAEVLLGLYGPGQMLIPHPTDTCYIQFVAHTDCTVTLKTWELVSHDPDLAIKIRSRLQQMEAWAAMQARPNLDQRIWGILSLLAEQFGRSSPQGKVVEVKITHAQLASAVGATRTTITRALGNLRRQGIISILPTKDGERYCLAHWEQGNHGLKQKNRPNEDGN